MMEFEKKEEFLNLYNEFKSDIEREVESDRMEINTEDKEEEMERKDKEIKEREDSKRLVAQYLPVIELLNPYWPFLSR